MVERVPRGVRGQQRGGAAGARDAVDQRLFPADAERVARRGVRHHDDRGAHLPERLRGLVDVPVELFDERFTTDLAEQAGGRGDEDARAAAHLLTGYLQWLGAGRA